MESWIDTQFIGFTCASRGACRRSKALVVACSVSVEARKARQGCDRGGAEGSRLCCVCVVVVVAPPAPGPRGRGMGELHH